MVCPICGGNAEVSNSRKRRGGFSVWRRRRCRSCSNAFTTIEQIATESVIAFKAVGGDLRPLRRSDVYVSVFKALGGLRTASLTAEQLTLTCFDKILGERTAVLEQRTIEKHIFETLSAYQDLAGQRYLLNELGRTAV